MKPCKFLYLVMLAGCLSAAAADLPATPGSIDVYVTPFYEAAGPKIEVGKYSAGLASPDRPTFLATIHQMSESWEYLSFAQLYVAAIRLYDLGYRKDAVYWYYSAEYRGRLFAQLVDHLRLGGMGTPGFELLSAQNAFYHLVGPSINGYAFGDLSSCEDILRSVKKREAFLLPKMNEIYPDVALIRRLDWEAANLAINAGMDKLLDTLEAKKAQIAQQRIDAGIAAKFAGLTSQDLPEGDRP